MPYLFGLIFLLASMTEPGTDIGRPMEKQIQYEHLDVVDGLSQGSVRSIAIDTLGFIWIASHDGLNRYDGREIIRYYHDPEEPNSLPANTVMELIADKLGGVYVATVPYLTYYDPYKDAFHTFRHNPNDPNSILPGNVFEIFMDSKDRLWGISEAGISRLTDGDRFVNYRIGNENVGLADMTEDATGRIWAFSTHGIFFYDPETDTFIQPDTPISYNGDAFNAFTDRHGHVWVGSTEGKLSRYSAEGIRKGTFDVEHIILGKGPNFAITELFEDRTGNLYVSFRSRGYAVRAAGSDVFEFRTDDVERIDALGSEVVFTFAEDHAGNLLIGTGGAGISIIKKYGSPFDTQRPVPFNPGSASNFITATVSDEKGNLYLMTQRNGLYYWDRTTNQYDHYDMENTGGQLHSSSLLRGSIDSNGVLWIGTLDAHLLRFDTKTKTFLECASHDDPLFNGIGMVNFDAYDRLWIVRAGLAWLDTQTLEVKLHIPANENGITNTQILDMITEGEDILWLGVMNGALEHIDLKTNEVTHYFEEDQKPMRIRAIHRDKKERFWVGSDNGLGRFYPESGRFDFFSRRIGFANHVIYAIEEDDTGILWASTNLGLTRYDADTGEVANYYVGDGLQGPEFNTRASAQTPFGELVFGGTRGFNVFRPTNFRKNPVTPRVVLTDLSTFGQPINLPMNVTMIDRIQLSHRENTFTLSYAGLEYSRPERNNYAFQLVPYDDDWHQVGHQGQANYTKVPPGQYIFKVKGSNGDGVWSKDIKEVRIEIVPPVWQTWWFRVLTAFALLVLILALYRLRMKQRLAQEAIMGELRTARLMQAGLMPTSSPQVDGLDVAGVCIPSEHVGGDFYDYLPMKDGSFGVALVDVNTRAMEGAMTTIMTSGLMHAEVLDHSSPAEILTRMNRATWRKTNKKTFVAMGMGVFNATERILTLSNAGLPAVMLYRNGEAQYLRPSGMRMPLGALEKTRYDESRYQLEVGDRILLFTDGITEAMDEARVEYAEAGLEKVFAAMPESASSQEIIDALLKDVRSYVKGSRFEDDVTLVCVSVL